MFHSLPPSRVNLKGIRTFRPPGCFAPRRFRPSAVSPPGCYNILLYNTGTIQVHDKNISDNRIYYLLNLKVKARIYYKKGYYIIAIFFIQALVNNFKNIKLNNITLKS